MGTDHAPLVEIRSARCAECGLQVEAAEISDQASEWPVVTEGAEIGIPRQHRGCGGRIELGDVRPAWHFCDDSCECGMGGLAERVE